MIFHIFTQVLYIHRLATYIQGREREEKRIRKIERMILLRKHITTVAFFFYCITYIFNECVYSYRNKTKKNCSSSCWLLLDQWTRDLILQFSYLSFGSIESFFFASSITCLHWSFNREHTLTAKTDERKTVKSVFVDRTSLFDWQRLVWQYTAVDREIFLYLSIEINQLDLYICLSLHRFADAMLLQLRIDRNETQIDKIFLTVTYFRFSWLVSMSCLHVSHDEFGNAGSSLSSMCNPKWSSYEFFFI